MNIIVDLDQHMAIESFSSAMQLSTPIQVKSQDTPSLHIYFVRGGVTYNLGSSIGLKFGLFQAGNPNPLVQELTFTLMQDPQARSVYVGYPPFNTTAMNNAIGTQASISAVAEVRYQLASGQVIHVLDIPFTVQRTLMNENAVDTTTAAFTVPAVNSNVNIFIGNTGWLSPNLLVNIAAGAGQYKVISITNSTQFVAQNTGITGNAAPATVIPSGTAVGIQGPNVIGTYPDPSVLELITHKNQANGYCGLNASAALASSVIPVDGSSVNLNTNGQIRIGYVIDTVRTAFTTPTGGATVNVNVGASSNFGVNDWVYIPIAGYYKVTAIVDGTHITIQNLGDGWNAISGTNITVGAVFLPQTALGSGGGGAGQNAYSNTTASFTTPASRATVSVSMGSTGWLGGAGYVVYINGAGYYAVSSITSTTVAVLTNLGYAGNVGSGNTVGSGALVTPGGLQGTGASGAPGSNAYDATTASFVMPAAAASVNVSINNTSWLGVGQVVYIAGAGYLSVASIASGTTFSVTNLNYTGNIGAGNTVASGAHVSPGGLIGAQGAGGAGLNAFTTLSANFTQPTVGSNVAITVGTTAWMAPTQVVYVTGGGYYTVASVTDLTHANLTNLGYAGNAASGATVTGSGTQTVSPGGLLGPSGTNAYTTTTAAFTMPAVNSPVTVNVGTTAWLIQGQPVYVQGAGHFSVSVVVDATHVALINLGATGNVSTGSVVASGAGMTASGAVGSTGPAGPVGASGSALINSALSIQGTGAVAAPVQLVNDVASPGNSMLYGTNAAGILGWYAQPVSGGAVADPKTGIFISDELCYQSAYPGYGSVIGTGSTVTLNSTYGVDGTKKIAGSVEIRTGTSVAVVLSEFYHGFLGSAAPYGNIPFGLGALTWKTRVFLEGTLPTTGIGYFFRTGVGGCISTANGHGGSTLPGFNQGFAFVYSPDNNSGQWMVYVGTTTPTATNTSVAVAGDTAYWLECDINAAWTSFTFYINGALAATVTSGLPNISGGAFWNIMRNASSSANYIACLDAWYLNYQFSR